MNSDYLNGNEIFNQIYLYVILVQPEYGYYIYIYTLSKKKLKQKIKLINNSFNRKSAHNFRENLNSFEKKSTPSLHLDQLLIFHVLCLPKKNLYMLLKKKKKDQ